MFRRLFLKFFGNSRHGTLASNILAFEAGISDDDSIIQDNREPKPRDISSSLYHELIHHLNRYSDSPTSLFTAYNSNNSWTGIPVQPQAVYCSSINLRGTDYTTSRQSHGDSMVIFSPGADMPNRAGCIDSIFVHTRPNADGGVLEEHFVVVYALRELSTWEQEQYDPYFHYPYLGFRLCHTGFDSLPLLIKATDIVSHFGSLPFRGMSIPKFCVVISLGRVSRFPSPIHSISRVLIRIRIDHFRCRRQAVLISGVSHSLDHLFVTVFHG